MKAIEMRPYTLLETYSNSETNAVIDHKCQLDGIKILFFKKIWTSALYFILQLRWFEDGWSSSCFLLVLF